MAGIGIAGAQHLIVALSVELFGTNRRGHEVDHLVISVVPYVYLNKEFVYCCVLLFIVLYLCVLLCIVVYCCVFLVFFLCLNGIIYCVLCIL